MTPAQLEHLKLIDAHLAKLLNTATERTPGKWKHNDGRRMLISVDSLHEDAILYGDEFEISNSNAAFIASCAGNAEAGWKAARAAIAAVRLIVPQHCPQSLLRENDEVQNAYDLMTDILAAFPFELIQKP